MAVTEGLKQEIIDLVNERGSLTLEAFQAHFLDTDLKDLKNAIEILYYNGLLDRSFNEGRYAYRPFHDGKIISMSAKDRWQLFSFGEQAAIVAALRDRQQRLSNTVFPESSAEKHMIDELVIDIERVFYKLPTDQR